MLLFGRFINVMIMICKIEITTNDSCLYDPLCNTYRMASVLGCPRSPIGGAGPEKTSSSFGNQRKCTSLYQKCGYILCHNFVSECRLKIFVPKIKFQSFAVLSSHESLLQLSLKLSNWNMAQFT